jgi:hypothetical protein
MTPLQQIAGANLDELKEFAYDLDIDVDEYRELEDVRNPSNQTYCINESNLRDSVFDDYIEKHYPDTDYDTDLLIGDCQNGNVPEDVTSYLYTEIVRASMVNGQWKQAREQCKRYGLDFEFMKTEGLI